MSFDDTVIEVLGLSKSYQVYASPRARLKQFVLPRLRRFLGLRPRDYFRDFRALEDVSFRVRRGETVGIVGRNGSGKSTLLQLICGTLSASAGHVRSRGRIAALLELGSGFNPEFTGRENVFLNGALLGLSRRQVEARFEEIAQFAAIGEFMDQPIKTYSSGMVVRLAFATAIHVDPDILVVDEALAVGDTAFQQKCLHRIRAMQASGVSILLVTHSSNTLIEYCDRGIYLRQGRLEMDGPCRDVVKAYSDDLLEEEGAIGAVALPASEDGRTGQGAGASPGAGRTDPVVLPVATAEAADAAMLIQGVRLLDADGAPVAAVKKGDSLVVDLELLVSRAIPEPCFGIQISSTDGIVLWSATTQQLGSRLPVLGPGRHRLSWRLSANFSGNRYVLAVGVGEVVEGEYRRRHRLDYAGHFDVMPEPRSGSGWLAPEPAFSYLQLETEGTHLE